MELWLIVLAVAGPVAGFVAFSAQFQAIRKVELEKEKLRLEIEKLKFELARKEGIIDKATAVEIERYAASKTTMFSRSTSYSRSSSNETENERIDFELEKARRRKSEIAEFAAIGGGIVLLLLVLTLAAVGFYAIAIGKM